MRQFVNFVPVVGCQCPPPAKLPACGAGQIHGDKNSVSDQPKKIAFFQKTILFQILLCQVLSPIGEPIFAAKSDNKRPIWGLSLTHVLLHRLTSISWIGNRDARVDPPSTTMALWSSSTLPLRVERASEKETEMTAASRLSPGALMLVVVLLVARERLSLIVARRPRFRATRAPAVSPTRMRARDTDATEASS